MKDFIKVSNTELAKTIMEYHGCQMVVCDHPSVPTEKGLYILKTGNLDKTESRDLLEIVDPVDGFNCWGWVSLSKDEEIELVGAKL